MKSAIHRLRQGVRALFAFSASPDLALAQAELSACEFAAFGSMSRADQLHSLSVLRALLELDPTAPPVLRKAALLHDVGKSRYHLAVWQKTLSVLILGLRPALHHKLSGDESLVSWRAAFTVRRHHPRWSAEILRRCGSDATVLWLAASHQEDAACLREHPHYGLLRLLQAADGVS